MICRLPKLSLEVSFTKSDNEVVAVEPEEISMCLETTPRQIREEHQSLSTQSLNLNVGQSIDARSKRLIVKSNQEDSFLKPQGIPDPTQYEIDMLQ